MEMIEIEAFVAVTQSGSFTQAAAELHISQPAVSRRIELLERELGLPLFERLPGGVRLTGAGDAFLPYARQVLAAARDGAAAVRALKDGERGTVTLGLVGTLASTDLTRQLHAFRDQHPDVRLLLRTARSNEVSALVQQGEIAIGLRYFEDPSPGIISHAVQDEALVVVCSASSRLVDPDVTQPEDLAGVPWIGFPSIAGSSGEPFARVLERHRLRLGLEESEFIAIDSLTAQKRLIEADFGIGLLPASSIEEEVQLGTLRIIQIDGLHPVVPVMAIHRRDGYLDPAAQLLLDALITPSDDNE